MSNELISGIAGGIAGGIFAVVAVLVQGWWNRKEQRNSERAMIRGVLQALLDEVDTLWARYMETGGGLMASHPRNEPFLVTYPVASDYFTIFNGNAFLIGRVRNDELRRLIVQTYTNAKGIVDNYRMNNVMLERLEIESKMFVQTQNPYYAERQREQTKRLVAYAGITKDAHIRLAALIDRLLPALRAEIARLSD